MMSKILNFIFGKRCEGCNRRHWGTKIRNMGTRYGEYKMTYCKKCRDNYYKVERFW